MSSTNTAPADPKPAACGACGDVDGLVIRILYDSADRRAGYRVVCPCGAEGPPVPATGDNADVFAVIAAWNARPAPKAKESKVVPCGACGGRSGNQRRRAWRTHKSGFDHGIVCDCGASSSWMPYPELAVAAWNRMWAPRAGEATKRLLEPMARWHAKAVRQGLDSYNLAFFKGIDRGNIDYFHSFADFEAMCLELGLAGGEGRG